MNDLMTSSFLSYVELKKQAQEDMVADNFDLENGHGPIEEKGLSQFFRQVASIKAEMEEISNILFHLQRLHEESKFVHSTKLLRGLKDQMEADTISILRKATTVKSELESLEQSCPTDRRIARSVTNGLILKLRETMNEFCSVRDKILSDHKEDLRRKYYSATGEEASDDMLEKLVSGSVDVGFLAVKGETDLGSRDRHEAVMDMQKSLNKLHQVFLDMALLVEAQGEKMDDIEQNVAIAADFINGGTHNLYYANQIKKKKRSWVFWVWAIGLILLLVCIISVVRIS